VVEWVERRRDNGVLIRTSSKPGARATWFAIGSTSAIEEAIRVLLTIASALAVFDAPATPASSRGHRHRHRRGDVCAIALKGAASVLFWRPWLV
jgi:hypothetical protein